MKICRAKAVVQQHAPWYAGASAHLQVGDRILLLATQPDDFLEVSDVAEASHDAQAQQPTSKRLLHDFIMLL